MSVLQEIETEAIEPEDFTQAQLCVWVGQDTIQERPLKISNDILRTKTQWVLMENQLNSSGQISQDLQH